MIWKYTYAEQAQEDVFPALVYWQESYGTECTPEMYSESKKKMAGIFLKLMAGIYNKKYRNFLDKNGEILYVEQLVEYLKLIDVV